MSESKMREALITAREVLRLEGYPDNNVAMVKIHSALALQPAAVVELTDDPLQPAADYLLDALASERSPTMLQRRLLIGYNRAARLVIAWEAKQGGAA